MLTTTIDSFFWQKPFPYWPELEVFIFNAIKGQSKLWGVLPFYWYFKIAVPKMVLGSVLFLPSGVYACYLAFRERMRLKVEEKELKESKEETETKAEKEQHKPKTTTPEQNLLKNYSSTYWPCPSVKRRNAA